MSAFGLVCPPLSTHISAIANVTGGSWLPTGRIVILGKGSGRKAEVNDYVDEESASTKAAIYVSCLFTRLLALFHGTEWSHDGQNELSAMVDCAAPRPFRWGIVYAFVLWCRC